LAIAPVPEEPLAFIRRCLTDGRIRWTYHVTMRLQQRNLTSELLFDAVDSIFPVSF
jgi:hypothetical protein